MTMYVILWQFRPVEVGRASSSVPTAPLGSGRCCSAVTTATSALNCSGTPRTPKSTSPWTAGSLAPHTKRSAPASAASISVSTACSKNSPKRRLHSAPSRCFPNQHRLQQDDLQGSLDRLALDQQYASNGVEGDGRDGHHVTRVVVGHVFFSTRRPMRAAKDTISSCGISSTPLRQLAHAPC